MKMQPFSTQEDVQGRLKRLAASYVPEWKYDRGNPDAGSVIALLIAGQIQDNVARLRGLPEQYHRELVNMLGLSPLRAKPAHAVVILSPAQDTAPDTYVPKGTKLLADANGQDRIIFETSYGISVTGAVLKTVFMTSKGGKIIPLRGSLEQLTELGAVEESPIMEQATFPLFDFERRGIERNALLLYHADLPKGSGQTCRIRIVGGAELVKGIEEKRYLLQYYSREGMRPAERWLREDEETLCFWPEMDCAKVGLEGKEYSLLAIEALKSPQSSVTVEDVLLSTAGEEQRPDFVYDGRRQLPAQCFAPFGDTLALYAECFIGCDACFAAQGAVVRLQLEIFYREHEEGLIGRQEEETLKVIKRKPLATVYDAREDTFAQEISLEYYNGRGWRTLAVTQPAERLFAEAKDGRRTIAFICPRDWKPAEVDGYEGRCIRMQLLKADNCYLRPCLHHVPVIRSMLLSYGYENGMLRPDRLVSLVQTRRVELTERLRQKKQLSLFSPDNQEGNALLLGFSKRFESGPVSLHLEVEKRGGDAGQRLGYEYSTARGFKTLKVSDRTEHMTKSGILLFEPPADMGMLELMGRVRCWIKVKELAGGQEKDKTHIGRITLNAVETCNVETLEEEAFYLEEAAPDMMFLMRAQHILDADVWVSEERQLTREQMERLRRNTPEKIRMEYNDAGEAERFFVKWEEVPNFDASNAGDRHYVLDRLQNSIRFGDGIHVRIPQNTQESAFTAVLRCTDGRDGNVEAGAIRDSVSNLLFVHTVCNPAAAAGGSSRESTENVLKRGDGILGGRNRLISQQDYVRETEAFSDVIHQARCVYGQADTDGRRIISLVLLLKGPASDAGSFEQISAQLKAHLSKRCELTLQTGELQIVEPFSAEISVEIWLETAQAEEGFRLAGRLKHMLEEYLNPVSGRSRKGWEIGTMPDSTRIRMQISNLKGDAVVKRVTMTVRYQDKDGFHETALERFAATAFHVCRSGSHKVHTVAEEKGAANGQESEG